METWTGVSALPAKLSGSNCPKKFCSTVRSALGWENQRPNWAYWYDLQARSRCANLLSAGEWNEFTTETVGVPMDSR